MRDPKGWTARLLVVDDNKVNRLLLTRSLELQGHTVASAENGRVALEMLRREGFDLLLLDMHLGDMTGLEVMQRLLHEGAIGGVPCVAVSADAMPATIEVAARAGFKAYLTKPLDVDAFLRCIDELWARPRSRAAGAYETA